MVEGRVPQSSGQERFQKSYVEVQLLNKRKMKKAGIQTRNDRVHTVADLGFVKEGFQVWAKPTSPRKRPKLGGSGGMPPQKIFANTDASRCILVHSGLYDSDIFYTLMLTAIPRLSVIKRHANAATPTMITS